MAVDIYRATTHDHVSLEELALYHAIMDYRAEVGLSPIRLSAALTATAGRHVLDTRENIWGEGREPPAGANYHSWSDAPYPADHSAPEVMWLAPQRLGTGYGGPGYEITAAGQADGAAALADWQDSPAHDTILTNSGAWADTSFQAIGVGAETSPGPGPYAGRIFHVWFGEVPDDARPPIHGSRGADRFTGTVFSDWIDGLGGSDRISGGRGGDRIAGGRGNDRVSGGPGSDRIGGGPGTDLLYGNAGADRLHGGRSRDVLDGGSGEDAFVFVRPSDAGRGRSRDHIRDFVPGRDVIELDLIDARPDLPGDQPFVFAGTAPGGPGTLSHSGGIMSAHLDGDGRTDLEIAVAGGRPLGADFLL